MTIYEVKLESECTNAYSRGTEIIDQEFYKKKADAEERFDDLKWKADRLMNKEFKSHGSQNKGRRQNWDRGGDKFTALVQGGDTSYNMYTVTITSIYVR